MRSPSHIGVFPAGYRPEMISGSIFQSIINATREAVVLVDASLRVAAANRHALAAFSREHLPLVGSRLSEVIRDAALHEAFSRTLVQKTASDVRLDIIAAAPRTFDVHIEPLEMEDSFYAVGVFYDVTKLENLEKMRQALLSNLSHELRTPLTSILAYVETLEDGAIDDRENNRRFLGTIRRNAERMHDLISDILELSSIESGNVSIEPKHVRLGHMVDEIFEALSSKASERDIGLINDVSENAAPYADPMRLEQMLTNLIDNAIKFNRPAGTVTVGFHENDSAGCISITDTGEGIMSSQIPRIFERFYRVDRGRTREIGGTGLGLAIVKHLARLHGGRITVSSVLGSGTTFTVELPTQ
ncbi:MAG: ATP-binding protein [Acidobacteria bacterium]|nr:ATP-binding protein [Acidobacteriota bacterium]